MNIYNSYVLGKKLFTSVSFPKEQLDHLPNKITQKVHHNFLV